MNEVTIHLYCRSADGKIEDAQHTFDLSDFGGFLPSVGDMELTAALPITMVPRGRRAIARAWVLETGGQRWLSLSVWTGR